MTCCSTHWSLRLELAIYKRCRWHEDWKKAGQADSRMGSQSAPNVCWQGALRRGNLPNHKWAPDWPPRTKIYVCGSCSQLIVFKWMVICKGFWAELKSYKFSLISRLKIKVGRWWSVSKQCNRFRGFRETSYGSKNYLTSDVFSTWTSNDWPS